MKKQIVRILMIATLGSLILVGCSAQRKLEGNWTGTSTMNRGMFHGSQQSTYTFNHDNTLQVKQHIAMGPITMDVNETGTYKLDGQHLDCTMTSMSMNSNSPALGGRSGARTIPMNQAMKLTWALKDNNTLDLTVESASGLNGTGSVAMPHQTVELKRQSS